MDEVHKKPKRVFTPEQPLTTEISGGESVRWSDLLSVAIIIF